MKPHYSQTFYRAFWFNAGVTFVTLTLIPVDDGLFEGSETVIPTIGSGMADWREKLFAGMHRNAAAAADFLRLPTNRVVELGAKVEI